MPNIEEPHIPWGALPIAAIDLETTGLDEFARIVEIAVVRLELGAISDRWSRLINPGRPIPDDASRIHGITDADVEGQPTLREAWDEVVAKLAGAWPLAYKAQFDRRVLIGDVSRWGLMTVRWTPALNPAHQWIDPLAFERKRRAKGNRLAVVCKRHGIELPRAHRALDDAEATAKLFVAQVRRGDVSPSWSYGELIRSQAG